MIKSHIKVLWMISKTFQSLELWQRCMIIFKCSCWAKNFFLKSILSSVLVILRGLINTGPHLYITSDPKKCQVPPWSQNIRTVTQQNKKPYNLRRGSQKSPSAQLPSSPILEPSPSLQGICFERWLKCSWILKLLYCTIHTVFIYEFYLFMFGIILKVPVRMKTGYDLSSTFAEQAKTKTSGSWKILSYLSEMLSRIRSLSSVGIFTPGSFWMFGQVIQRYCKAFMSLLFFFYTVIKVFKEKEH